MGSTKPRTEPLLPVASAAPPHLRSGDGDAEAAAFAVSPVRWYCLFLASLLSGLQGAFWGNFGPISGAVIPYYGWDDGTIAWLNNWGPIAFLLLAAPSAWLMDNAGFKASLVFGSALVFAGAACRLYVAPTEASAVLMHVGQFLNACAGPMAMAIGPPLSATWFAPNERTLSTAIVGAANYGMMVITFAAGPLLVPAGADDASTQRGLWRYMLAETVASGLLLLGALAVPPRRAPPSRSSTVARVPTRRGAAMLAASPTFWALSLSYGVLLGFMSAWGSMIGPNMASVLPAKEAEAQGGWLGFWGALAGMLGGVVVGALSDRIGRKKGLLLGCCGGGAVAFLAFALVCGPLQLPAARLLPYLYASSIVGTIFAQMTVPLFYELTVEAMFPVAEGLVTAALTSMTNVSMIGFLLVQNWATTTLWMNWAVAAACVVALVALLPVRERQFRLELDLQRGEAADAPPTAGGDGVAPMNG